MLRDETHLIADRELVERSAYDTIAVEIDLAILDGCNEPIIFLWEQPDYATVIGQAMQFDFTAINTGVILDLAAGGGERVVNRDGDILVRAPGLGFASDHDFASGNRDVESDPEQIALMVPPVLSLDGDAARHDLIEKPVELRGRFTDSVLDAG
jgi:hypothetical protein